MMNKKIIYKRHCMWYDKRHPWNLFDDLANYIKYSLRDYALWLEKYCPEDEMRYELDYFDNATNHQNKDMQDADKKKLLISTLKKMYFSFDQVSTDFPDSPWNVWWNKNCAEHALQNFKRENGHVTYEVTYEAPDNVKEAQKKYDDTIDEGIKLYADLVEFVSFNSFSCCGYRATKKAHRHQLRKIDSIFDKFGMFQNDQAWYIHEGLVAFKKSKRYGTPCNLSEDDWEKYLDDMIFTFHEIAYCNEFFDEYDAEEYEKKYNRGKELFGKYFLDLWD